MDGEMAEKDKRAAKSGNTSASDARKERLAQALRSNLLKRKENTRAKRSAPKPPEEGRQG
ncbi:hypothetical protein AUC68_02875 [Methyloceanibacter methanicus]|uniref:Uncharacterized protein n=2 Tax=Methyloceanibacter methanicus TaxID=1774968 RepID=A0A1E3W2Q8_9HYPH|nr:hypothetical protein AUC68_02875 [Methyloceanibacter methanicus]